MASGIYNIFKANLMNKEVDLDVDTIKVALYDSSHSFTATDTDYTAVNEVAAGDGYTTGGEDLASTTVTGTTTAKWDAEDAEWTTASFTARHAVIYDETASDKLIANIDFGGDKVVAGGTFTIQWDEAGIITLT